MKVLCGVDVSKARLDACIEPGGTFASFENDAAGVAALAAFCRQHRAQLVVMEASGGCERQAFLLLWEASIACALTNPRSVRRYAEAMGILEKTDRIDAGVIARFGIAKDIKPTPLPNPQQRRLKALVARLRQVTDDLTIQKQRRSAASIEAEMLASLDEVIALLKRQSRTLEGEIASVRGGRESVRSILFLVAEIARRFDPSLAQFHRKLSEAGKPKMVVRVALARKLLVRLNAKARDARSAYAHAT